MKIVDTILRFPIGQASRRDGICRVRVFAPTSGIALLLTDLGDLNTGKSVTNAIEMIHRTAVEVGLVDANASVIEHYEHSSGPSLDIVTFSANGSPSWATAPIGQAISMLGCSADELNSETRNNSRLMTLIERIRNQIDPFIDTPISEPRSVTLKRLNIDERKISKAGLASIVEAGAGERELQRLLKTDLSIFGEIYAPDEEYIAFSEFPLEDGFVDFAIFTGRSRMDVIFVEIKGADFHLANGGSYGKFASKIEEGAYQIRTRLGAFVRNYEPFRQHVHAIRKKAEAGTSIHNALLGPRTPLEVDPNKDVNVRYIVIGGRTRDDAVESRMRNEYERSFTPSIKLESWDSWLRKLRRP
jgi:Domain of unknown function (DUF4263)